MRVSDYISAKGSIAQGRNGRVYLLTQKLTNLTTGDQLELRGDRDEPLWSGKNLNGSRHGGFARGTGRTWSGMMRAGRGMMGR
jgi:hypothetical protein